MHTGSAEPIYRLALARVAGTYHRPPASAGPRKSHHRDMYSGALVCHKPEYRPRGSVRRDRSRPKAPGSQAVLHTDKMWSDQAACDEDGEPVLLLVPSEKKRKCAAVCSPSSSFIGGHPCFHAGDTAITDACNPVCNVDGCSRPMHLLIQLHAPLDETDRTLYVFGCNRAECYRRRSNGSKFTGVGNDGPLRCLRSQKRWSLTSKPKEEDTKEQPVQSDCDWGAESDGSDGWGQDDTWGMESGDQNIAMSDLESMLEKCDVESVKKEKKKDAVVPNKTEGVLTRNDERNTSPGFEKFDLDMVNEPSVVDKGHDDDDDDEMLIDARGDIDATKIDQMLSKYMSQEDDDEILGMLSIKGGTSGATGSALSGKKDKSDEKYERLPPDERALISFASRLRRVPQQVSRYAWGGEALWSIPVMTQAIRKQQAKQKLSTSKFSALPDVPSCACGAKRLFEFQLLPSILHKLEVDSHLGDDEACSDMMDLISSGGMNWGNLAIYSCSDSCEENRDEFIVLQESVSDTQERRPTRDADDDPI